MKAVTLQRLLSGKWGTFSRLTLGWKTWWALERPATGEHPRIPVGEYKIAPAIFYGGDGPGGKPDYPCYEVLGVPGRDLIKVHVANVATQLRGCIAPGLAVEWFNQFAALGVSSSGDAFKAFMAAMGGEPGTLTITEDF